jgi:hypothetical protein
LLVQGNPEQLKELRGTRQQTAQFGGAFDKARGQALQDVAQTRGDVQEIAGQAKTRTGEVATQAEQQLARDVENREQRLGALDRGAQAIVVNATDNRKIDATENLAMVQDYSNSYKRYLETIAPTLGVNTTTTEDKTKTTAKFGGVKKYVSRLGDLKNNRTFKA